MGAHERPQLPSSPSGIFLSMKGGRSRPLTPGSSAFCSPRNRLATLARFFEDVGELAQAGERLDGWWLGDPQRSTPMMPSRNRGRRSGFVFQLPLVNRNSRHSHQHHCGYSAVRLKAHPQPAVTDRRSAASRGGARTAVKRTARVSHQERFAPLGSPFSRWSLCDVPSTICVLPQLTNLNCPTGRRCP